MQDVFPSLYLWLKIGHVVFMVFWMAGLFMLPRQMIYCHDAAAGSQGEALWAKRMGLLRKIILTPSLIVVWVLGLLLAMQSGAFSQGWFHAKLLLVIVLTGYHGMMVARSKAMARGERPLTEKQLRVYGEVPGILLAFIVVLVVVRPF